MEMLFKITADLKDGSQVVYYFHSGVKAAIKKKRLEESGDIVKKVSREMVFNRGQKTED